MSQAVIDMCAQLVESLFCNSRSEFVQPSIASTFVHTVLPRRDYDLVVIEQQAQQASNDAACENDSKQDVKKDVKRARFDTSTDSVQLSASSSANVTSRTRINDTTHSTTITDAGSANWCDKRERDEAVRTVASHMGQIYGIESSLAGASIIGKLGRTLIALLLEPTMLCIELIIRRPDRDLDSLLNRALDTQTSPSDTIVRKVANNVVRFSFNLFSGCPEFAIDVQSLDMNGLRSIFYMLAFRQMLFAREKDQSALHTRLVEFRHNSLLEGALGTRERLIGGVCLAALDAADPYYADMLRQMLISALDVAQSMIGRMTQSRNRSPQNLDTLRRVQARLRAAEMPAPRVSRARVEKDARLAL